MDSDDKRLRGSSYKISSFVRLVRLLKLSEGVASSILLRIGRAWVETKGLCEGIQDLWSPCRTGMCRRRGVGQQLRLLTWGWGVGKNVVWSGRRGESGLNDLGVGGI